jgi:hypothetical protein
MARAFSNLGNHISSTGPCITERSQLLPISPRALRKKARGGGGGDGDGGGMIHTYALFVLDTRKPSSSAPEPVYGYYMRPARGVLPTSTAARFLASGVGLITVLCAGPVGRFYMRAREGRPAVCVQLWGVFRAMSMARHRSR